MLFLILFTTLVFSAEKAFIQITVDKEIITNVDIKKESDYLKILNPNLSTLGEKRINEIAKKSLITEIIKNKEINKFLVNNENNEIEENLLKNLYTKLNLSKSEFENLLIQKKNYTLDEIKKKLMIDILWNDLIYFKFKDQIKIDKNKLLTKIEAAALKDKKEYLLSEIIFEKRG